MSCVNMPHQIFIHQILKYVNNVNLCSRYQYLYLHGEHTFSGACVNWPNFEKENVWNPILIKIWILNVYSVSKDIYWYSKFNISHTSHLKTTKFPSSLTHWWLSNHLKNTTKFFVIILFSFYWKFGKYSITFAS
jgi:hypothetical protein